MSVSVGLTVSRKKAQKVAVWRKKLTYFDSKSYKKLTGKIFSYSFCFIFWFTVSRKMVKTPTVSYKSHRPIENLMYENVKTKISALVLCTVVSNNT